MSYTLGNQKAVFQLNAAKWKPQCYVEHTRFCEKQKQTKRPLLPNRPTTAHGVCRSRGCAFLKRDHRNIKIHYSRRGLGRNGEGGRACPSVCVN